MCHFGRIDRDYAPWMAKTDTRRFDEAEKLKVSVVDSEQDPI